MPSLRYLKNGFISLLIKPSSVHFLLKNEPDPVPRYSHCTIYGAQFTDRVQFSTDRVQFSMVESNLVQLSLVGSIVVIIITNLM